jgi:2',3'-cyclic-nucleotide 2'-phosphodiesterase (5'-nucleotidase family)
MSASSLPPSTSALPSTPVSIETTTRTAGTAPGAVSGPAPDAAAASRKHALPAADRGWLPDAVSSDKAARGTTRATAARKAREDAEEALPRDTSMADADRSVIEALQGVSAEGGAGGVQVAQAGSGGVVSDAPIVLAQASGATGAGAATVPAAAVPPATGTVFGSMGWLAALGAVGVAAAASSSDSSAPAASTPTAQGTVIDGYLSGATVFIDVNDNGQLDAGEPNTTTDAQGNYTLPGGIAGTIIAFGGTDISTGLEFKGALKAPSGSTVVTPLTTLVTDLVAREGSVAAAEAAVFRALGLGGLDSGINLLTFDPVAAAQSTDPARSSAGLELQKGAVLIANMVTDLVTQIQQSSGAGNDQRDDIARDIFSTLADRMADNVLTGTGITALATGLIDAVAARSTVGGVAATAFRGDLEAGRDAFATNHTEFRSAIEGATTVGGIGDAQRDNQSAVRLLNASVDGLGDVITLYFDRALDEANLPSASQFTVTNGTAATVSSLQVVNNQVRLMLSAPLDAAQPVQVSFADNAATNDTATVQDRNGVDARSFSNINAASRLSLTPTETEAFAHVTSLTLAGAEISAFDPASDRLFVTSSAGLQVLSVGADLSLTLLGTVSLGSNDVNSVAVKNGLVAVAVAAGPDKTLPGTVFFLDADAATIGPDMVVGSVQVGALPDMLTFSADGRTVLVANEAEQATAASAAAMATVANPEGSVSIIDLSGGAAAATVRTASFAAFNSQRDALKAAGVRLMAGEVGFETVTVAQDLEPEYIAISGDGRTAFVTLQENNAIAVLDIARATFTGIVPLGLKSFFGLPFDGSDRDGPGNTAAINLQTDRPVFGQYMPDSIASFSSADGRTWYLIANEGDDRDDFITPDETARVSALNLDAERFPDAAALRTNGEIGRLTVSNAPGNNGDTDGDGDIDRILAYGARSFSILNADGMIVFDSGSHMEQFVAAGGVFTDGLGSGLFDDTRSDNKGPEPEGLTVGRVGDRTLAFVGLERGGGGVMVYDVTNPLSVSFVEYLRRPGDVSPEGLTFIGGADSPTGQSLLVVTNEVSNTVSVFQNQTYTLQLLHLSDGEAGLLASSTAPRLAAMIDRFEDVYANSITLAGGDNFIPGPFLAAGTDSSVIAALNAVSGSTLAPSATVPIGAADIVIHNLLGVEASTIGNHEFDLGSRVFRDAFTPGGGYVGAQFPYLSANLDFSGDADLSSRFSNTPATPGLELASSLKGRIAPSAVIVEGGERIGLVGATTQLLEAIASPSGTEVRGFPTGPGANGEVDDIDLLAAQLQPVIDDLIGQGVNKIILMSHLQVLANERLLATKLSGVDIILAAGSNTRLGDANDTAVAFPGHAATFADTYPVVIRDKTGGNTLLVNTDNEYTYLGRLVVDFDNAGNIRLDSLAANALINGAYAATEANVARAWGVEVAELDTTAFAAGTRGKLVSTLTDAVQSVIEAKDGNVYGFSTVYLEGERAKVRSEETNLGNLTADANRYAAIEALGDQATGSLVVSIKNGGGIRAQIGAISSPKADGTVDLLPPEGGVSQLDVENSLRFNNQLMVFDTTPEGLKAILEHSVAAGTGQGRFPQLGGVAFSWDPDFAAGSRVSDIALVSDGQRINLYNDGVKLASAPAAITVVTLNFLANGGDSYPMKANGENFRYLIEGVDGSGTFRFLSDPVDEALNFTAASTIEQFLSGTDVLLGEQSALATYLETFHGTEATAFTQADTPLAQDTRIQNLNFRSEAVLTTELGAGDVRFIAANSDSTDAFSFILLRSVTSGTQIGFTDRNFSESTGMPASGEGAYLWTADRGYTAGTIVTIQPDAPEGPTANRGIVRGDGGGLSASGETIYAFQGSIAGLLESDAGAITIDRLLASLNVGGAATGDVPASIAAASQSFNADNAKFTASTSATDIAALVALIDNPANWTLNDTTAFALSNGSLF